MRLLPIDRTLCCVDVSFPPHRIYPAWWAFQLSAPHSRCFSRIKNTEAELIQSDVNCTYDNNRTICNLHIGSYRSFFLSYIHCNQRNQRKHRKQQSASRKKGFLQHVCCKNTPKWMDTTQWMFLIEVKSDLSKVTFIFCSISSYHDGTRHNKWFQIYVNMLSLAFFPPQF